MSKTQQSSRWFSCRCALFCTRVSVLAKLLTAHKQTNTNASLDRWANSGHLSIWNMWQQYVLFVSTQVQHICWPASTCLPNKDEQSPTFQLLGRENTHRQTQIHAHPHRARTHIYTRAVWVAVSTAGQAVSSFYWPSDSITSVAVSSMQFIWDKVAN